MSFGSSINNYSQIENSLTFDSFFKIDFLSLSLSIIHLIISSKANKIDVSYIFYFQKRKMTDLKFNNIQYISMWFYISCAWSKKTCLRKTFLKKKFVLRAFFTIQPRYNIQKADAALRRASTISPVINNRLESKMIKWYRRLNVSSSIRSARYRPHE